MVIPADDLARLRQAPYIWLATVRENGIPHLVPIWFVWDAEQAFICTSRNSVKARNIALNPSVCISLEDAGDPIVLEGEAAILNSIPAEIAKAFETKYDWNIRSDTTYDVVIRITPRRMLM